MRSVLQISLERQQTNELAIFRPFPLTLIAIIRPDLHFAAEAYTSCPSTVAACCYVVAAQLMYTFEGLDEWEI
jgi:hypothetical protein